jgi:hypothetical protein
MTTVINNPGDNSGEGAGLGLIIGLLIVIVAVILFFVYGLPAIRASKTEPNNTTINVEVPNPIAPSTDVTVEPTE